MSEPYCFGRFVLDAAERRLWADGVPVALGSTDLRILLALVENAGTVVSKDQLISRVWGRSVVTDNVLYVHINALRKALGDEFIENEQRRGYRFVQPVQRMSIGTQPQSRAYAGNLPPLSTEYDRRGPSRLIGRSEQLGLLSELLTRRRLVTLTGYGGVGKTSLALQAAREAACRFPDGVWLVELASLSSGEAVAGAIATVFDLKTGAKATALETLSRYLTRKSLLIVLDNCEHVVAACASIADALLSAAPHLTILATSREPVSSCTEQVVEVPPLAVPGEIPMPAEEMRKTAAIELFIERATGADASFRIRDEDLTLVARICRRLDGLPLALEMVAGWASILGLENLDTRLSGPVSPWLRARINAPQRHSTLRATLEWSHGLLTPMEQAVLRRLAVFAGSFSMQGAEAVAADEAIPQQQVFEQIAHLVRKSMIAIVPGSRAQRFRLLETTRAFVGEILAESGEGGVTRWRHACHVLQVLERAIAEWETTSDAMWLGRYAPIVDDLRAALDWSMAEEPELAISLAGISWPLWRELSLRAEGSERLNAAAGLISAGTPPELDARLRHGLGEMCLDTAASKAAHHEFERAAVFYRGLNDGPHLGRVLTGLGFSLFMLGRNDEAEQTIAEAVILLERAGWLRSLATAYSTQLCIQATSGHYDRAFAAGEKAVRLCRIAGADRTGFVVACNLAQARFEAGDIHGAVEAARNLAGQLRGTPYWDLRGFVLAFLAGALTARGDLNEALSVAREATPLLRDDSRLFWLLDHLALHAALRERAKDAALITGYVDSLYEKFARPREAMGARAIERTITLVGGALLDEEITELTRLGAQLSEDQAVAIALDQ